MTGAPPSPVGLSIVLAVQHAQDNLPDILAALRPAAHPGVEFILCHTPADPRTPELADLGGGGNLRVLRAPAGSLIPHLWRDGILAARGERVATTTAHCIPAADWVERLAAADLEGIAGVGGTIGNAPDSDAKGWAVQLLRYAPFAPPQAARDVHEIAADNALYRRADLLRHRDLLAQGFWEPSFHARFRAEGLRLRLDPTLRVTHRNRYTAAQFAAMRLAHGRAFGLARAGALPLPGRLRLALLSPGVPLVLLRRIVAATRGKPALRGGLIRGAGWLAVFLLSWSAGEARGYAASLVPGRGGRGAGGRIGDRPDSGGSGR